MVATGEGTGNSAGCIASDAVGAQPFSSCGDRWMSTDFSAKLDQLWGGVIGKMQGTQFQPFHCPQSGLMRADLYNFKRLNVFISFDK